MANLVGAYTALTPRGTPGQVAWAETNNVPRAYTEDFTAFLPWGVPGRLYGDFTKVVSSTAALAVSDTASLSATEDPVDSNEIATTDTARLGVTDAAALFNFLASTDTATLLAFETISLAQSGVTLKTASDTTSLSASEAVTLNVSIDVTDTASLSVTDSSAVDVSVEEKSATDTASLTLSDEAVLLNIFTGVNEITVSDAANLRVSETASVIEVRRIKRIALSITRPYIELEIL